jgi:CBS domain-containing protein
MNSKLVSSIDALARSRLVTASVDALLVSVAQLLSDSQISLVVVCDSSGAMAGVITKSNIVQWVGQRRGRIRTTTAADMMTRDVTCCHPTDCLPDVLSMMQKCGFVHIPVVDEDSKPLGVVNARDALRALFADEKYQTSLLRDYVMGVGYR